MDKISKAPTRRLKYALLGATMLMSAPLGVAQAQDTAKTDATAAAKSDGTVVVVTGFKKSYADAVKQKKTNIEITDGISSDGLGRFPDLNVGEALQRIPGVQINREAEGRNATIGLRGMPGYYARTTLNGMAFAVPPIVSTTGGADSTPLGAFNSDIFTAFVVEKSPMANAQSGGLSGNIDMQIAPALSRKDGGFAKASEEYDTLGKKSSPAFTVGYNKHFGSDFAMFGTLAYKKENFERDTLRPNGYSRLALSDTGLTAAQFASQYGSYYGSTTGSGASCSGAIVECDLSSVLGTSNYNTSTTGSSSKEGVWYLNQIRQYIRVNEGNLWTGSGGLEWKPNDNTKAGVIAYFTDRNLPNTTQYFQINQPWMGQITTSDTPFLTSDGRAVIQNATWTNYYAKVSSRLYSQHQAANGIMANLDWHNELWHLTGAVTASSAYDNSVETELDLATQSPTVNKVYYPNGLVDNVSIGNGSPSGFSQNNGTASQNSIFNWAFYDDTATGVPLANRWNWNASDPENLYSADQRYVLNISGSESFAKTWVNAAQFDAERELTWGPITSIKGGVRLEQNAYHRSGFRNMAYGAQTQNITQAMLITPPNVGNFMEGHAGVTTNWMTIDPVALLAAIKPVTVYNNNGLSKVGLNINLADGAFATNNFRIANNLSEAYVQAKFDTNLFGVRLRGNAGVRAENTEYIVNTLDQTSAFTSGTAGSLSNFAWQTYSKKYTHLLPSAIVVADIAPDMLVRGAYYKTYVAPDPQNSNPGQKITGPTADSTYTNAQDYGITMGSSRLKPYTADSYDVSWEWYNRPNSLISLDYFEKVLHNRVVAISDEALLCPADGGGWGLGTLTYDGTHCTASSPPQTLTGKTVTYVNAGGQYNVSSPTYVSGLELNIQQNFDFLPDSWPAFWKNFGGDFNYAFTTASQRGKGAGAVVVPFPGISKYTYNYILFYETPTFGIRAVYNWRSDYALTAAGTYTGGARTAAARGQLDVSASYNISDRVTLSFDGYNMTNSYRREYENDPRLVRWVDWDGRTYTFTLKTTF